jgi:hypothetical protein
VCLFAAEKKKPFAPCALCFFFSACLTGAIEPSGNANAIFLLKKDIGARGYWGQERERNWTLISTSPKKSSLRKVDQAARKFPKAAQACHGKVHDYAHCKHKLLIMIK